MRNLHGFDACVCFSLLHFCGVECISKSVFLLVCPFLFVKHALRSCKIWQRGIFSKGCASAFARAFARSLLLYQREAIRKHCFISLIRRFLHFLVCSITAALCLSLCSFTNSSQLQHNYRHICWCSYIHIPAPKKKKLCFFSPISSYMEAISPLPCWLLRTGLFFVPSCVNQDVSWECHM